MYTLEDAVMASEPGGANGCGTASHGRRQGYPAASGILIFSDPCKNAVSDFLLGMVTFSAPCPTAVGDLAVMHAEPVQLDQALAELGSGWHGAAHRTWIPLREWRRLFS